MTIAQQPIPSNGNVQRQALAKAGFQNQFYADDVIDGNPGNFDAVEVQGVSTVDGDPDTVEVDNEAPEFFTVYLHIVEGGVVAVADVATHAMALRFAEQLAAIHDWSVYDFVVQH